MQIISGKYRGRKLKSLESISTRPTLTRIKDSLFSMLDEKCVGSIALDLFAGSGALGIEALSRGAKKTYLVDINNDVKKIIESNLKGVNEEYEVICGAYDQALKAFRDRNIKFDLVFLDPPYRSDMGEKAMELLSKFKLLNGDALVCFEHESEKRLISCEKCYNIYKTRTYGDKAITIYQYKVVL